MNDRKQHVLRMAHQLFIEKGFQATSIQDILDYSGISKGTFYNYFSSKNELLISLFKSIHSQLDKERNELLIGKDPSDIEVFIKQIELQLQTHRSNKLISLFDEVVYSPDEELKVFFKQNQLRAVRWLYRRFIDIFGERSKPYLLDCSIMFIGILHYNLKFHAMAYDTTDLYKIVRYSVERLVKIVSDVTEADAQLIQPGVLNNWFPNSGDGSQSIKQALCRTVLGMKKSSSNAQEQGKYLELLDFIQDELLHANTPRIHLVNSAISTLEDGKTLFAENDIEKLKNLAESIALDRME
ncbi:TetR/AcrR family transcriptional regulator [Bacillus sp. FJAT-27251]|uniref:TetR/AcrR family transcriptional regulator n=1 Tax=Bacillus sp. FJAT-27251 TaxID=1684142 RepID=UPI0006A76991|nr:TetR/AcrR family transcriptional regulator [Bacillus sp. FJAT-27251]